MCLSSQGAGAVMKCRSVIRTHSKSVSRVVIQGCLIVSAGQDCAITVIRTGSDGSVMITHVLQVSVPRH